MKWWRDKYSKLDAKLTDAMAFNIFQLGVWVCLFIFVITNSVAYFLNQYLAERAFWFSFDIALICFSIPFRNKTWVTESFFAISIYNLCDEIMGFGALLQWYEFPMALTVILFIYLKHKQGWKL